MFDFMQQYSRLMDLSLSIMNASSVTIAAKNMMMMTVLASSHAVV